MGDRSPKDKHKKKEQQNKEVQQKQQHKQDNMAKHRQNPGQPAPGEELKKAG